MPSAVAATHTRRGKLDSSLFIKEQQIMIPVFIGYDGRETVAYNVLAHSIQTRASQPVSIAPLMLSQLNGIFKRERHPLQSTDFSFSRFLTPYLSGYSGWSVFMDCDMLALEDIAMLWALRDDRYAVMVIQHDHVPKEERKFLNEPQSKYQKKNWSSVMLFNNARCKALTPDYVNTATGLELHQFKWLGDDHLIGALPNRWNHLVGYDAPRQDAALVHYTLGGPYFDEFRGCEYSTEWFAERDAMLHAGVRVR
jgi:hypothetical protein